MCSAPCVGVPDAHQFLFEPDPFLLKFPELGFLLISVLSFDFRFRRNNGAKVVHADKDREIDSKK